MKQENKMSDNEKGPYLLKTEIEKSFKVMKNRKVTECFDVLVELQKPMEEERRKILVELCRQFKKKRKWPKQFQGYCDDIYSEQENNTKM